MLPFEVRNLTSEPARFPPLLRVYLEKVYLMGAIQQREVRHLWQPRAQPERSYTLGASLGPSVLGTPNKGRPVVRFALQTPPVCPRKCSWSWFGEEIAQELPPIDEIQDGGDVPLLQQFKVGRLLQIAQVHPQRPQLGR